MRGSHLTTFGRISDDAGSIASWGRASVSGLLGVRPGSILSKPMHYLRRTVAASETFQAWTGTASRSQALERVHLVKADGAATLPLAVVGRVKVFDREQIATGTRNIFEQHDDLGLILRAPVDDEHTDADASYAFLNELGALLTDMEELTGTAKYLDFHRVELEDGPYRPGEDEAATIGDFYEVMFRIGFN